MADKKIALITGGNTGIGYESVKALYASPEAYTILLGSRSLEKGNEAASKLQSEVSNTKSEIVPLQIDIESDESIENAFKEVESKFGKVDALINNAGASFDLAVRDKPGPAGIREAWDHSYSVNVTSTQVFTTVFIPLLLKSSDPRLLFITSGLSSLTNCSGGQGSAFGGSAPIPKGWPKPFAPNPIAYRSSKTALNMMMLDWNRLLAADGVKVWAISPGFLATGLAGMGADVMRKLGAGEPHLGGVFIKDVVEGKRDNDTGKVIRSDQVQAW
ncbi:NAD(P)-binding protein [Corynespora cassiicola Philippines]|uniref:NAD(P)-binding protein n=1 Tax=Corynespora cassiicola Philippines TaxID=1448308 RepID=A0A2T2NVB9_CORCC|nr:NAD(P)-binding protein [Corynespora cassiicola Philippines]